MRLRTLTILAVVSLLITAGTGLAKQRGTVGAVYTMTNDVGGNEVVAFDRHADGSLSYSARYDTGGLGSGGGLGNQGGVALSDNGRWLLVVNAGSDEISVFSVHRDGLTLADTAPSGGGQPVSVAIHRNLVYVVHAGSDNIAGLRLGRHGMLSDVLPGSYKELSGTGTAPAQIGFSMDGRFALVTEKATNLIDVFQLNRDGSAGDRIENSSNGPTPFAFDFGKRDQLFVSEVGGGPGGGAVSVYDLGPDGYLQDIDASVPNNQTAPCWLVVTKGARYVFTTNTPDNSLSAYSIDFNGKLDLVDPDGRTGEPGEGTQPLDMDLSDDGRFLYTLNVGNDTISTFRVKPDGSLMHLGMIPGVPGANGLAAR